MFDQKKDKFGDLFTTEEFASAVACGAFIPDDGCGWFGTETHYTYEGCIWRDLPPAGATHVHWFNK